MLHDLSPLLAFACAVYSLERCLYLIYLPVIPQGGSRHLLEPTLMSLGKVKAYSFPSSWYLWQRLLTFHEKFISSCPQSPLRSCQASGAAFSSPQKSRWSWVTPYHQQNENRSAWHLSTLPFSVCQLDFETPRLQAPPGVQETPRKRSLELKSRCGRASRTKACMSDCWTLTKTWALVTTAASLMPECEHFLSLNLLFMRF